MTQRNAAILSKAADILEHDGWTQFTMHTPGGQHCTVGAIGLASGYHRMVGAGHLVTVVGSALGDHNDARRALQEFLGVGDGNIPPWNDNPYRTPGEVIDALRTCAEKEAAS